MNLIAQLPVLQMAEFWVAATSAVLIVAYLASRLLARSAAVRHLVWFASFVVLLLIPVLTAVWHPRVSAPTHQAAKRTNAPPSEWAMVQVPSVGTPAAPTSPSPKPQPAPIETRIPSLEIADLGMAAIWFAGLLFVGSWAAAAFLGVRVVYRKSTAGDPESSGINRLAARLRVKRPLSLRLSQSPSPPTAMTWGTIRPVVLLPQDASTWPSSRREAVMLHEIAHVRRLDYLSQIVAIVVCAVFWYNPLVWLAAKAMRHESELASDDAVIRSGFPAADYAAELLTLAAELGARRQPAACLGVSLMKRSRIEARIRSIVNPANRRTGLTWSTVGAIMGGACFLAFLVTFIRPSLAEKEKTQNTLYEEAVYLLTLNERRAHHPGLDQASAQTWHPPLAVGSNGATTLVAPPVRSTTESARLAARFESDRKNHRRSPRSIASDPRARLDEKPGALVSHQISPGARGQRLSGANAMVASRMPSPPRAPVLTASAPTLDAIAVPVQVTRVDTESRPVAAPIQANGHFHFKPVPQFHFDNHRMWTLADKTNLQHQNFERKAKFETNRALKLAAEADATTRSVPQRALDNLRLASNMKTDAEVALLDKRGACPTSYNVPEFSQIAADGDLLVRYVAGKRRSVRLLSECGSQDGFSAHVTDGVLHLSLNCGAEHGQAPVVDVVSPDLKGFSLDRQARAVIRGHFWGPVEATLNGSSAAAIEGTAEGVVVCVNGSSNLTVALNGTTVLSGWVNGSSNVVADGTVRGLDIHEDGNSMVSLSRLTAPTATAAVAGASWLDASGSAVNLTTSVDGQSVVSLADLNVKSACISADGASHMSLGLSQSLSASAAGSSKITYKGNPSWLLKNPADSSTILSE